MRIRPLSFNLVFCFFAAPLFAQEANLIAEGNKKAKSSYKAPCNLTFSTVSKRREYPKLFLK